LHYSFVLHWTPGGKLYAIGHQRVLLKAFLTSGSG
jgi:hypothetical protein